MKKLEKLMLMMSVVALIALGGCSSDDDEPKVDEPNANFTFTVDAEDPLTVQFTDASVNADTYDWSFGDGNSSDQPSPIHTYAEGGTYPVTLVVTNKGGEAETSQSVTVEEPMDISGNWVIASEAGALGVGSAEGVTDYWAMPAEDVEGRVCGLDDVYSFGTDGTFTLQMDGETFLEPWQWGEPDKYACGAPVAPHDGTGSYTYSVSGDEFTLSGEGAFIGLAKVVNEGELPDAAVPSSITYKVLELTNEGSARSMTVSAVSGANYWTFKLVGAE